MIMVYWFTVRTSSLDDLSCRGGVAGDAWLSRSGRTLLVRVLGVPLFSPRFCSRSSDNVNGNIEFVCVCYCEFKSNCKTKPFIWMDLFVKA